MMNDVIERGEHDYNLPANRWAVRITPEEYFERYIKPYVRYTKMTTEPFAFSTSPGLTVYLEDGSRLRILIGGTTYFDSAEFNACKNADPTRSDYYCHVLVMEGGCTTVYYDTNGDAEPNQAARDIFRFNICDKEYGKGNGTMDVSTGEAISNVPRHVTRAEALATCRQEQYANFTCTRLLKLDNWEFKDDYPWRL